MPTTSSYPFRLGSGASLGARAKSAENESRPRDEEGDVGISNGKHLVALAPRRGLVQSPLVLPITLLNAGIYTLPDAARLTKVSPSRIRRWLRGYDFRTRKGARAHSDPVWSGQLHPLDGKIALGFSDLMEIRYVAAFLAAGVNWKTMRRAHVAAKTKLQTDHPFCAYKFKTDGRNILLEEARSAQDVQLIDIANDQREFERIVAPFFKDLELEGGTARWWPLGRDRSVVLDPSRNLGQPCAAASGVPTSVLARSVKTNGSIEAVSHWFEVGADEVRDALEFEAQLAA